MSHISLTYHIIWRTKYSHHTISETYERDLYAYIHGICKTKNCTLHRINSMPDHIHICVEINPALAVSDFMKVLKQETSNWIKMHREWFPLFEAWGNGYAAFTYSAKDRNNVVDYIKDQKEHHKDLDFREEYMSLMKEFGLDSDQDMFLKD